MFSCKFYWASALSTIVEFAYVWNLVIKKIAISSKNVWSNISKSSSDIKRAKKYDIKHTDLSQHINSLFADKRLSYFKNGLKIP